MCIYVYLCVYEYVFLYVYIYICIHIYTQTHKYIYIRVYVQMVICINLYIHQYIYVYTYIYIHTHVCTYLYINIFISSRGGTEGPHLRLQALYMYHSLAFFSAYVHTCIYTCMCVCVYVCINTCTCMYIFIYWMVFSTLRPSTSIQLPSRYDMSYRYDLVSHVSHVIGINRYDVEISHVIFRWCPMWYSWISHVISLRRWFSRFLSCVSL